MKYLPLTVIPPRPSGNAKTGRIGVSYRTESTCPTDCTFYRSGCYGTGRLWAYANKSAHGMTIEDATDAIRKASPNGARYFRDRVLGDIANPDGTADIDYLLAIAAACDPVGVKPYGYTHTWRAMSREDVDRVRASGYALNASCETTEDVQAAHALGLDPVLVNDNISEGTRIAGRKVITCPEQTGRVPDCASCGICATTDRRNVIRFTVHGTAKRAAHAAIDARE